MTHDFQNLEKIHPWEAIKEAKPTKAIITLKSIGLSTLSDIKKVALIRLKEIDDH